MSKGGKYLAQKVPAGRKKKILPTILIVLVLIIALCVGAAVLYYNYLLGLISKPSADMVLAQKPGITDVTEPGLHEATMPEDETTGEEETASSEETWPEVVSDENITNFMLVGNAYRPGEEYYITDTMILVSVNRETKTITLTSLMRDMCLVWPEYVDSNGRKHTGNNRINMAYNMGYSWTKNKQDSMDVLESIVQYNFGVPVERTVEIDFDLFDKVTELLGGVQVELSQEEITYLQENYPASNTAKTLTPGVCELSPYLTLCYARMRKVGHGDYDRTERQRTVIIKMIEKLKGMNIFEINKLFQTVLPYITTDMTSKEITNYALEFIPMLKDLKIQSQRIPFEGNEMSVVRDSDYMIAPRDLKATAKQLQESIGMPPVS